MKTTQEGDHECEKGGRQKEQTGKIKSKRACGNIINGGGNINLNSFNWGKKKKHGTQGTMLGGGRGGGGTELRSNRQRDLHQKRKRALDLNFRKEESRKKGKLTGDKKKIGILRGGGKTESVHPPKVRPYTRGTFLVERGTGLHRTMD